MKPQQQRSLQRTKHTLLLQSPLVIFVLLWGFTACSTNPPVSHPASATPAPACSVHPPVSAPPITAKGLQKMLPLPGSPFASVATRDGHWVFVSLDVPGLTNSSGIVVLQSDGGNIKIAHFIALPRPHSPAGLALTHDERLLVVADGVGVSVLATAKMEAGAADALQGSNADGSGAGTIKVTLSQDERYVFATDEYGESLSVINFAQLRAGDFSAHAYVGRVLLDPYPVGMALSSDGRYLYITSENSAQATSQGEKTPGTLSVVDVARAENTPARAVVGRVIAGCSPVRVVLSPQNDLAWVTARGSNTLLAFKTSLLLTDPAHALIATITVGPAPVGLILIRHDTQIVVASSNRFTGDKSPQTVMLVDVKHALSGSAAVLGSISVESFPREMALDGSTLLLTNYTSKTLSLIDLSRLP